VLQILCSRRTVLDLELEYLIFFLFLELLILCIYFLIGNMVDRLYGLVVRVLGYRSGGLGSIPATTKEKNVVGLKRAPLSLVSTTEELLDRNVAVPV
jgi:hypothetical protein